MDFSYTTGLTNHIYHFYEELELLPQKKHYGLSINYTDIDERRDDFLSELINTIVSWVYNKNKYDDLFKERYDKTGDSRNVASFIVQQAYKKFRTGHPQGQFGELLLFNLLQHYYKAIPLLRKMPITTSAGQERFGVDALHYKKEADNNIFILGEAKTYESKYKFNDAFKTSLSSIITTFDNLTKELDLYTYDDFLEPELEHIVKKYKEGTLEKVKYELVCLIVYNETNKITGDNEETIKESIREIIKNRCISFDKKNFENTEERILLRLNYIVFPIWKLDELLDNYQKRIGI